MNAIAPARTRFKTLTAALEEVERLESQVIALNAALASRTAAPAKTQTPTPPPSAPAAVNQPAAAATTPAAKSIDAMSRAELATAADEAHTRGDAEAENRYFRAHAARMPTHY